MSSELIVGTFLPAPLYAPNRLLTECIALLFPWQNHDRLDPEVVENTPGRCRMIKGRRQGKHEHTIPILASEELHVAAGGLSNVGSSEFDIATREWSLSIDTRHTLKQQLSAVGNHKLWKNRMCDCPQSGYKTCVVRRVTVTAWLLRLFWWHKPRATER